MVEVVSEKERGAADGGFWEEGEGDAVLGGEAGGVGEVGGCGWWGCSDGGGCSAVVLDADFYGGVAVGGGDVEGVRGVDGDGVVG